MNTPFYRGASFAAAGLIGIVLTLGAAGCGQPDPKQVLEGSWKVRPSSAVVQGVKMTDDNTTQRQAREIGQFLGSFMLSFRPDGTFTFNMGPTPLDGKWTVNGNKVTMDVTSMAGHPVPPGGAAGISPLTGEIDTTRKTLEVDFPKAAGGAGAPAQHFVFEKPSE